MPPRPSVGRRNRNAPRLLDDDDYMRQDAQVDYDTHGHRLDRDGPHPAAHEPASAARTIVAIEKLTGYCLNPHHPRGRHKARLFWSVLGLDIRHAAWLRAALIEAAKTGEANASERDLYGQRYVLDFEMVGLRGSARVRSLWIVRTGEVVPRLTSCYVLMGRQRR